MKRIILNRRQIAMAKLSIIERAHQAFSVVLRLAFFCPALQKRAMQTMMAKSGMITIRNRVSTMDESP